MNSLTRLLSKRISIFLTILILINANPLSAASSESASSLDIKIPGPLNRLVKLTADKYGKGPFFSIRDDLKASLSNAIKEINSKGGVLTAASGLRSMNGSVGTGRSASSLHYLGRAVDLSTTSGMGSSKDKYVVVRDGGTDENPYWKIFCKTDSKTAPLMELTGCIWQKGKAYKTFNIKGRFICITDILEKYGWHRIASNSGWKDNLPNVEWWHFQNTEGLTQGDSTFGGELLRIYTREEILKSDIGKKRPETLEYVWRHNSFGEYGGWNPWEQYSPAPENTPVQVINGSFAAVFDEWLYYNCGGTSPALCKINLHTGEKVELCPDNCRYITVIWDWIYYSNLSDKGKLYRIRINSAERQVVDELSCSYLYATGDRLYYYAEDPGSHTRQGIYRISPDSNEKYRYHTSAMDFLHPWFMVSDGWIYYMSKVTGTLKLKRLSAENDVRDNSFSENCGLSTYISGGNVYYTGQVKSGSSKINSLLSIDTSRNKTAVVKPGAFKDICFYQDYLYCLGTSDEKGIFRMRGDCSNTLMLCSEAEMGDFCIVDNFIYFYNNNDGKKLYRMLTDGSGKELVDTGTLTLKPVEDPPAADDSFEVEEIIR